VVTIVCVRLPTDIDVDVDSLLIVSAPVNRMLSSIQSAISSCRVITARQVVAEGVSMSVTSDISAKYDGNGVFDGCGAKRTSSPAGVS